MNNISNFPIQDTRTLVRNYDNTREMSYTSMIIQHNTKNKNKTHYETEEGHRRRKVYNIGGGGGGGGGGQGLEY